MDDEVRLHQRHHHRLSGTVGASIRDRQGDVERSDQGGVGRRMNKVIQSLIITSIVFMVIGTVGYFASTVRDEQLWPWFTMAGMLSSVALLLAVFTKE